MNIYVDVIYDGNYAHCTIIGEYFRGLVVDERIHFTFVDPFYKLLRIVLVGIARLGVHSLADCQIVKILVELWDVLWE